MGAHVRLDWGRCGCRAWATSTRRSLPSPRRRSSPPVPRGNSAATVNPPTTAETCWLVRPSLIRSLIQLRPEPFGARHPRQAAEVTDSLEPAQTHTNRIGKRAGAGSRSLSASSALYAPGVRLWAAPQQPTHTQVKSKCEHLSGISAGQRHIFLCPGGSANRGRGTSDPFHERDISPPR